METVQTGPLPANDVADNGSMPKTGNVADNGGTPKKGITVSYDMGWAKRGRAVNSMWEEGEILVS